MTNNSWEKDFKAIIENYQWDSGRADEEAQELAKICMKVLSYARQEVWKEAESEVMNGNLRERFEELFPKDEEASEGGDKSKSNRSAAIVLWGFLVAYLRAKAEEEKGTN